MRSGTSCFDGTVFKKTVCRFWPLWGAYFALWLVAMPLNGLMVLRSANYDWYGGTMEYFSFYRAPRLVTEGSLLIFAVFGVLAAMAVFSHLYNARSANLFGSLPIRREGMFLTHYLAGLAFILAPNAVIFLLTLAVEAAGGCVVMKGLLFWLAVACGEGFFFYSLAVFCAMFTGHILALPAFYAIVNFFVLIVTQLVEIVFNSFYYGFAGFPDWVGTAAEWFTPTVWLSNSVACRIYENWDGTALELELEGLGTVGIYALVAAALAAAAFFLYRARRLESAGDVVAVRPMRPVFKYGVALCAGLGLGMGTAAMIGGGEIPLMIAIAVWGIIGYFAAEMLLQKSFRVFKKWKGAAAVTAVFIVLFLVVGLDLTGYETRIPDPAGVDSVDVSGLEVVYLRDDGDHASLNVTDPEYIRLITLLHRAALEQRDEDSSTWYSNRTYTNLTVTYHLKNGGALTRRYYALWLRPGEVNQEGTAAWAIQQLYNNRELCWRIYGFDRLEDDLARGGRLVQAEYNFYNAYDGMQTDVFFYGGDAETLLAAVKEDFFAGRIGVRRVVEDPWEIYESDSYRSLSFSADSRDDDGYDYITTQITIALSDTASGTLAAMEEMADRAVVRNGSWYDGEYSGEVIVVPTAILG